MKKLALLSLALPLLLGNADGSPFKNADLGRNRTVPTVSVLTVGQLAEGMTRRQVRALLGAPHFGEGVMVRGWNYVMHIADKNSIVAKNCQLRIDFDKKLVSQIRWENPECAEMVR